MKFISEVMRQEDNKFLGDINHGCMQPTIPPPPSLSLCVIQRCYMSRVTRVSLFLSPTAYHFFFSRATQRAHSEQMAHEIKL